MGLVFSLAAASSSMVWFRSILSRHALPVMASIRRTPEATEHSLSISKGPTLAVLSRWVPPHSSME